AEDDQESDGVSLEGALRVITRGETMDRDIKRVTQLLAGRQLGRPAALSGPHPPDRVRDGVATLIARARRFRSVKRQNSIKKRNLGGHLHYFTSHGVVGAFGRAHEQ